MGVEGWAGGQQLLRADWQQAASAPGALAAVGASLVWWQGGRARGGHGCCGSGVLLSGLQAFSGAPVAPAAACSAG